MDTSEIKKWFPFAILLGLLALALLYTPAKPSQNPPGTRSTTAPEITTIQNTTSTEEQTQALTKLLDRAGPVEAQEQMLRSGLPFTGQTHLLIHTIGNYIYDKHGLQGLPMCREYFLSACYHGFIINALSDHGMGGVVEALVECESAPSAVFSQCSHAAGHGFVAWQDYDLVKALNMCDELGVKVKAANFPYFNCYDGVFMENVWGVHGGKPSEKRWVKADDFYYPCNDPRIPEKYLSACWADQATLVYQYYKGDLKKTAELCDTLQNNTYKQSCYDNFARQIHPISEGKKEKVVSLCMNATGQYWRDYCMLTNVTASWSVGDRVMPFAFCNEATGSFRKQCFDRLVTIINFNYAKLPKEKEQYCSTIADKEYQEACRNYNSSPR